VFSLINSAVNMALPACAAERRAADPPGAVDQYVQLVRRSAANPPHAAATVE